MKNTLLYLAFVVAGGATVVAFASGATWAGILSAAAGLLALGAVFTGRDTE